MTLMFSSFIFTIEEYLSALLGFAEGFLDVVFIVNDRADLLEGAAFGCGVFNLSGGMLPCGRFSDIFDLDEYGLLAI